MSDLPSILLFFIDGLGIGKRGPFNPFDGLEGTEPLAIFEGETNEVLGGIVVPTDAQLGISGRPQSASGQTTILTGINAPARLGYHKQGFPNTQLLDVIKNHSIFLQLKRAGVEPITFANAYTDHFFVERPRWVSATTAAVEAANLGFRRIADVSRGRALYQDFTNGVLIERGERVERRTPLEAAAVLARLVKENRFTLYEYFITDKIGHAQDISAARKVLPELASVIRKLLTLVDLNHTSIILTSDHGNIEDLSSRTHTLNAVPTIVWGAHSDYIAAHIRSLSDITPTIFEVLTAKANNS